MLTNNSSGITLATKYVVFACVSTACNIGAQDIFTRLYQDNYHIQISIVVGTGVGLITKYVLDKRYIFSFTAKSAKQDIGVFILYSLMGVFTTVIFWGTEYLFHYIFQTKYMRYLGAMLGLALGYSIKYQLDKKFVFNTAVSNSGSPA